MSVYDSENNITESKVLSGEELFAELDKANGKVEMELLTGSNQKVVISCADAAGNVTWYGNATNGDNEIIREVGTYTITLTDGVVISTKQ